MSGGGGAPTTSTTTSINYSPEETARRTQLQDIGLSLYNRTGSGVPQYPGAKPYPFAPETFEAHNLLRDQARTGAGGTLGNAQNAVQFGLSDIIYGKDPTLDAAIQASVRPIVQSYTDPGGYFAQNRADMIGSNMLGSSRDALANAVLGGRLSTAVGDTAAKVANAGRSDTLNTFGRTLAAAPDIAAAATMPAQWLSSIGTQTENFGQSLYDYDAQKRTWDLNYPWMNLQNLASIVYGGGSPGTSSTQTGTAPRTNPIATAAGLASTAASIASIFAMSDRRFKTNVKRIGWHAKYPIGIYEYDLAGSRQQGVMADEVQQVLPAAVYTDPDGYQYVNYSMLG